MNRRDFIKAVAAAPIVAAVGAAVGRKFMEPEPGTITLSGDSIQCAGFDFNANGDCFARPWRSAVRDMIEKANPDSIVFTKIQSCPVSLSRDDWLTTRSPHAPLPRSSPLVQQRISICRSNKSGGVSARE